MKLLWAKPITESKAQPPLIDAQQLRALVQGSKPVIVVDVRSAQEFAAGTVEGAINVPADQLSERANNFPKDATIVTVCNQGGPRSCAGNFYADPAPQIDLRQPSRLMHWGKIAYEKYWLNRWL